MTKTFWRLSEERQEWLLNICADEFASNGYEISSTNSIVRRAGISKGLFFKYFVSKASVYLYLVRSVLTEIGGLQTGIFASADIVIRSEELFSRHMNYARRRPSRYQMALRSALETEPAIRDAVERIRADVSKQFSAALYEGVDWTMYNLPKADVVEFLKCLDLGLRQSVVESPSNLSNAARLEAYIRKRHRIAQAILRDGLYSTQKKEDKGAD
jgi:AcrR family transcriptional regulator